MYNGPMKYVAKHLNRHHLFHAPHRWFFALLLSPIHAAELHYQKRYHLQFAHARKLFLFDLSLIALIVGLISITAYWFWYDPTISEKINISITPHRHETPGVTAERIQSGEHISFVIEYQNNSGQNLENATLRLHAPDYYEIETVVPTKQYVSSTFTFNLGTISRHSQGMVEISGMFYNEPDKEDHFIAELTYLPSERKQTENRLGATFLYARGSVLQTTLELPNRLPASSVTTSTLVLYNSYHHDLPRIVVPFPTGTVSVKPLSKPTDGVVSANEWRLERLPAGATARLPVSVQTYNLAADTGTVSITPYIFPTTVGIRQATLQKTWAVAKPKVTIGSAWEKTNAAAGSSQKLTVTLHNLGTETIQNLILTIPLGANVDATRWSTTNSGGVANGVATITRAHDARLVELQPGKEITLNFFVPIKNWPTGTINTKLLLPIHLRAQIAGITSEFNNETLAPELPLGTALRVSGEARYYTAEGDQLGRGPLPPLVGKQTKYALLLHVVNSIADAENVRLTATIPNGIEWTGKTSVSRGQEISYDPRTRRISWSMRTFPALSELSAFVEVGFTPTETLRGQTVPLLQNIIVEGTDTVLNESLRASAPALTSALTVDTLAQSASTAVR